MTTSKRNVGRWLGYGAAGLGLCAALAGCGGSGGISSNNPVLGTTSAQYGPLRVTLTTLSTVIPGVAVDPIRLTVENVSQNAVTLSYLPGPDASVTQNGVEVWNDGNGVAYGTVLVPITLAPGQSQPFGVNWPKINNENQKNPAVPVSPGRYVVKGWEVLQINGQTVTDANHTAPTITVTLE